VGKSCQALNFIKARNEFRYYKESKNLVKWGQRMGLPKFLQPCLASYDLAKMDSERDKEIIITSVLNKGDFRALNWLGTTYSRKEIEKVVSSPIRGMWLKSILSYWQKIFNIKLRKEEFKQAILNLNP